MTPMKLAGFAYVEKTPPVEGAYIELEEYAAILGANDTGKSQLLLALSRALEQPDQGTGPYRPIGAVLFVGLDRSDVRTVTRLSIADLLHSDQQQPPPGQRELWSPEPWHGLDSLRLEPASESSADPVETWRHALLATLADSEDRASWDALLTAATTEDVHRGAENLIAFEPDIENRGRTWNLFWCLPPFAELPPVLQTAAHAVGLAVEGRRADLWSSPFARRRDIQHGTEVHTRAEHRCLCTAPLIVAPVGRLQLPLLPTAIKLPTSYGVITREIEEVVGSVAAPMGELDDLVNDGPVGSQTSDQAWLISRTGSARVAPDAAAICRLIIATANRILPPFVSELYELDHEILSPHEWAVKGRLALRVWTPTMRKPDLTRPQSGLQIDALADGFHLWVQLALLEATRAVAGLARPLAWLTDTLDAAAEVIDGIDDLIDGIDEDERERAYEAHGEWQRHSAGFLDSLRAGTELEDLLDAGTARQAATQDPPDPSRRYRVNPMLLRGWLYVLDEPERHLHPVLQRRAARWLADTVRVRNSQVVLATHSVAFMSAVDDAAYNYLVRVGDGPSAVTVIDPPSLERLDLTAEELGLDRGELIALMNVILWVEGRHDQVVIEELFSTDLRRHGIVVAPMHSTSRRKGVLDAEVLLRFSTAKAAVCFDNVGETFLQRLRSEAQFAETARSDESLTSEERSLADLELTARQFGRRVELVGHPGRDVFEILDDDAIRDCYPQYPGHTEEHRLWDLESRPQGELKEWRERTLGVPSTVEAYRLIAARMAELDRRPPELARVIDACEMLALESGQQAGGS